MGRPGFLRKLRGRQLHLDASTVRHPDGVAQSGCMCRPIARGEREHGRELALGLDEETVAGVAVGVLYAGVQEESSHRLDVIGPEERENIREDVVGQGRQADWGRVSFSFVARNPMTTYLIRQFGNFPMETLSHAGVLYFT